MLLDSLVDEGVLVVSRARDPVLNSWDDSTDVIVVKLELRIVRNGSSLVKVGSVDEVPA